MGQRKNEEHAKPAQQRRPPSPAAQHTLASRPLTALPPSARWPRQGRRSRARAAHLRKRPPGAGWRAPRPRARRGSRAAGAQLRVDQVQQRRRLAQLEADGRAHAGHGRAGRRRGRRAAGAAQAGAEAEQRVVGGQQRVVEREVAAAQLGVQAAQVQRREAAEAAVKAAALQAAVQCARVGHLRRGRARSASRHACAGQAPAGGALAPETGTTSAAPPALSSTHPERSRTPLSSAHTRRAGALTKLPQRCVASASIEPSDTPCAKPPALPGR